MLMSPNLDLRLSAVNKFKVTSSSSIFLRLTMLPRFNTTIGTELECSDGRNRL